MREGSANLPRTRHCNGGELLVVLVTVGSTDGKARLTKLTGCSYGQLNLLSQEISNKIKITDQTLRGHKGMAFFIFKFWRFIVSLIKTVFKAIKAIPYSCLTRESMTLRYCIPDQVGDNRNVVNSKKNTSLILIIVFILFILPQTYAEDSADLGQISVTASENNEVSNAPSSFASVIKPSEQNISFENVSELLSASPGVTSRSLGGLGQFSTISIRGSSPEQVSVYIDGIRVNTASGGAFDFSTIPMDIIDRIEVIRGGGTAMFGSNAIGGVINIITKEASKKTTIEGFSGGGSFTTLKFGLSFSKSFTNDSLIASVSHMQSKGDYGFNTSSVTLSGTSATTNTEKFTRLNNGFISDSFLVNWKHTFNKNITLSLLNDFFFTNRNVPGTEEETTLLYPQNALEAKERIFRNTSSLTLDVNEFIVNPLQLKIGASNNFDYDRFKDKSPAIGIPINKTTNNYAIGSFLNLTMPIKLKPVTQIITLRYDYMFNYLTESSKNNSEEVIPNKQRHTNSIFLQDELNFLNDKIIFLPIFRFEKASDFSSNTSFKTGALLHPFSWLKIKSNFERSYRYPSFNELYYPDQGYIRGNPDLNKERAWNLDAGIEVNTKYANASLAYFRNWVDNSIIFVPISATTIEPVNTYDVDIQGIETELQFKPIKYVNGWVNYTFLDATYASSSNQLPGRPKHEFNGYLELTYDFSKKISTSVFGRYNYKYNFPLNPTNTVFLGARSKLDLGFNIRFLKHYYFNFEALNVTNVQMYDARGFPLPRLSLFATIGGRT